MTDTKLPEPAQGSLSGDLFNAARYYLGSRTGIIAIAATALGLGLYFNWGWVVAAGIAPILIAVAPCGVMCALGLCMGGRSRAATDETGGPAQASPPLRISSATDERQAAEPQSVKKTDANRNRSGCC